MFFDIEILYVEQSDRKPQNYFYYHGVAGVKVKYVFNLAEMRRTTGDMNSM